MIPQYIFDALWLAMFILGVATVTFLTKLSYSLETIVSSIETFSVKLFNFEKKLKELEKK